MLRENNSKQWFTTLFAWLTFIFQELEKEHLSHEKDLLQLKSTILSEQSSLAKEILVEITSKMDTIIQSYNATCSSLLGISLIKNCIFYHFYKNLEIKTKYESSQLLWERFDGMTDETGLWISCGVDRVTMIQTSSELPHKLIEKLKVKNVIIS